MEIESIEIRAIDNTRVAGILNLRWKEFLFTPGGIMISIEGEVEIPNKFTFEFATGGRPVAPVMGSRIEIPFESESGASSVDGLIRAKKTKIDIEASYRYISAIPRFWDPVRSILLATLGWPIAEKGLEIEVSRLG